MDSPFDVLSSGDDLTEGSMPNTSLFGSAYDTSRAQYRIQDIETFAADLNDAAKSAFSNRGRSRYDSVNVWLLRWEEDEFMVQPELGRLNNTFQDYGFRPTTWHIPSQSSHLELMTKAVEFIRASDNDKNLFIVYYGGHGRINSERQAEWICKRDPNYARVHWSAIQTLFAEAKSDVLMLLDTCTAASATTRSQHGSMEAIMACGFESKAPPPGEHSFTNTLIEVLDEWINRRTFSASCLHAEILSRLKLREMRKSREGIKLEWCVSPIHINCTQDSKALGIELCRRNILLVPPGLEEPQPFTTVIDEMDIDFNESNTAPSPLLSLSPSGKFQVPHVLISVALEENQPNLDVKKTTRWLESIPLLAKWAKVESVFPSYSTLLILTLPVPVWDMLPDHPACSFIGYVTAPGLTPSLGPSPFRATSVEAINNCEGKGSESGSESSFGSSSSDEKRIKKMKGKQLLTAGLAAVATIHAAGPVDGIPPNCAPQGEREKVHSLQPIESDELVGVTTISTDFATSRNEQEQHNHTAATVFEAPQIMVQQNDKIDKFSSAVTALAVDRVYNPDSIAARIQRDVENSERTRAMAIRTEAADSAFGDEQGKLNRTGASLEEPQVKNQRRDKGKGREIDSFSNAPVHTLRSDVLAVGNHVYNEALPQVAIEESSSTQTQTGLNMARQSSNEASLEVDDIDNLDANIVSSETCSPDPLAIPHNSFLSASAVATPGDSINVLNDSATESMYRAVSPRILPQKTYLSILVTQYDSMQKKIEQLNQKLISEGRKDLSLNPTDLAVLKNVLKDLESSIATQSSQAVSGGLTLAIKLMTAWPYNDRLPGLDLLRLLAVAPRTATYTHPRGGNIVNILEASITEQMPPAENNLMMAIRAFANLFGSEEGRTLAFAEFDKILSIADTPSSRDTRNRNLLLAVTTLYINYAVLLSSSRGQKDASPFERALYLLDTLRKIINTQNDPEVIYRTLVATGTLLGLSNRIRTIAKGIYSIEKSITIAIGKATDARIRNVAGEIMASLRPSPDDLNSLQLRDNETDGQSTVLAPSQGVGVFTPSTQATTPPISLSTNPIITYQTPPNLSASKKSAPVPQLALLPEEHEIPLHHDAEEVNHAPELVEDEELARAIAMSTEATRAVLEDEESSEDDDLARAIAMSMEATHAVSEDEEEQLSRVMGIVLEEPRQINQSSNKGKGREMPSTIVDNYYVDDPALLQATLEESRRMQAQRQLNMRGENSKGASSSGHPHPKSRTPFTSDGSYTQKMPLPNPASVPHSIFSQAGPSSTSSAEPFGVLPPLIHISLNTGLNYTPPTNTGGSTRQWNIPVGFKWPVKIPKDHQASAYAIFFVLIFMDWNLAFRERPTLTSHQRLYDEHHQILKNFLDSVQLIKNGVDHHSSVKSTLAKDFPHKNSLQLDQVLIWEILMLSPKPMTAEEIATALSERKRLAFVGSRWQQLVDLVGAEEIYFCVYRPGGFKTKLQGLDIVHVALSGDDAAFQRLKSEIRSSHNWLKEICLGLKGVLSMVGMAAATSDNMMKAQMGLQIQERVREVFGPISVTEFNKSMGLLLGGTDPTDATLIQKVTSFPAPLPIRRVSTTRSNRQGLGIARPSTSHSPSFHSSSMTGPSNLTIDKPILPYQKDIPTIESTITPRRHSSVSASALYEQLDKSCEEIRLLEILPQTDADPTIRCRLRTKPLRGCNYIALSYVWGDSLAPKDIIINGEGKSVSTNLVLFLQNIRSALLTSANTQPEWTTLPNLIWVDAICINQDDIEERNHQIQLMGRIYTGASMVIAWLGPYDRSLSTTFRTFRLISSTRRSMNAGPNDTEWMRSYPELWLEDSNSSAWTNKSWEAVDKFLRLPNWHRVWILQEMVLATRLWLMAGVETLDFRLLVDISIPFLAFQVGLVAKPDFISNALWSLLSAKGFLNWSSLIYIEQLRSNLKSSDPQGRQDCLDLIWSTLSLRATDPKDKIFGLLGICNYSINPDYSKSAREVYSEFGKEYIRSRKNLALLNHAELRFGTESRLDLPTWVPDFQAISSEGSSHSIETGGFDAGRHIASIASLPKLFVDDRDHLHAFGQICDTASAVYPRLEWGSEALFRFCINYLFGREDVDITETLQLLIRKEGPRYTTGISRLQALFQTFLQGVADFYFLDQNLVEFYYRSLCFVALINSRKEWSHILPNHELLETFLAKLMQGTAIAGYSSSPDKIFTDFYAWVARVGGHILSNLIRHSFFQTVSGYLGLGPRGMREDDLVCVLGGSLVPVILRRVDSHYIHVGPCFILGLRNGEAKDLIESGTSQIQEFEIY